MTWACSSHGRDEKYLVLPKFLNGRSLGREVNIKMNREELG
jgi:hypothetical protein